MNNPAPLPDYLPLAEVLGQHEPAELHGRLCGQLCADPGLEPATWLTIAATETDADAALNATLQQLFATSARQLASSCFDFHLLLPDDDQALALRTEALAGWCQGFLVGLGLGGLKTIAGLPGDVGEFLRDVGVIAQVDTATASGDDGDEVAYAEIVEFLRIGVLLVQQALHTPPGKQRH